MKKLISGVCIALTMTMLVSCGTEVTNENFVNSYTAQKEEFDNAKSTMTTTESTIITETNGQSEDTKYTTIYSETKGEDGSTNASAILTSDIETDPLRLEMYYKDGILYGSNSIDTNKIKLTADYNDFKNSYNSFYFLDILPENVVSSNVEETDAGTVVSVELNKDGYQELIDTELHNIESFTMIQSELLNPEFSNINYAATFDKNGNLTAIDTEFTITMTISYKEIFADLIGDNEIDLEDQVITRKVGSHTVIDQVDGVEITYPEDLDTYTDLDALSSSTTEPSQSTAETTPAQ